MFLGKFNRNIVAIRDFTLLHVSTQQTFTYSKPNTETLEKDLKYVQSQQLKSGFHKSWFYSLL